MKFFGVAVLFGILTLAGFANAADKVGRKPAAVNSTIWETPEIPIGKACPYRAQRFDQVAYQVGGDGGYVCFMCNYTDQSPLLVVTEQTKCSTTLTCKRGKCEP